jgi:hypothetical protein
MFSSNETGHSSNIPSVTAPCTAVQLRFISFQNFANCENRFRSRSAPISITLYFQIGIGWGDLMSETIQVSKLEAAQRQLNMGVRMMFAGADPIAVHTLFGAAANLFSDLVAAKCPDDSWDKVVKEANNLEDIEYIKIVRNAQNFLKHADKDPDAVLELALSDTDALAFGAVMNASALGEDLCFEAQVFQLWYIAIYWPREKTEDFEWVDIDRWFGELHTRTRKYQLEKGLQALADWKED